MRTFLTASAAAVALLAAGGAWAKAPAHIEAALASKARPEADVSRDAARKPGDLMTFAEVKPGQKVADFVIGGGYFTRILAAAVGEGGQVYAYQPAEFIAFQASYGENLKKVAAEQKNITALNMGFGSLDLPDGLDLILTVQNYHDMHLKPFPPETASKVNAELFKSLKKGGLLVVVDHAANAGTGLDVAHTLHRIDPAIVRKELEAAGFQYVGSSDFLKDAADPHTANVFDPAIRGKTDQFTLKFKKP
jgi:predicted methyltransferase